MPPDGLPPGPLPSSVASRLAGYHWRPVAIGESRARVFHLTAERRTALFVKIEPRISAGNVRDEAARLIWLGRAGIPCPEPVFVSDAGEGPDGDAVLVTTALAGRDLASSPELPPAAVIDLLVESLSALHALPVAGCPFDQRRPVALSNARRNVAGGEVDVTDFDDERQGMTAAQVLEQVERWPEFAADLVVTHGDACLPNFLAEDARFTGFVDCGRLGVADRYQDLALCARSIVRNLGPDWVGPFWRGFGIDRPDPVRRGFHLALDDLM